MDLRSAMGEWIRVMWSVLECRCCYIFGLIKEDDFELLNRVKVG